MSKGTPHKALRVDPDLWERFGEAVTLAQERYGEPLDRSAVLREFMRWYAREDDASLPVPP
jgi:hypothetical protein